MDEVIILQESTFGHDANVIGRRISEPRFPDPNGQIVPNVSTPYLNPLSYPMINKLGSPLGVSAKAELSNFLR